MKIPAPEEKPFHIRLAAAEDLLMINDIYNQAVVEGFTADTDPVDPVARSEWFENHKKTGHPIFVYVENNHIRGWLSFSPYRYGRYALRFTAEVSYYVDNQYRKRGVGTALLGESLSYAVQHEFKTLFTIILEHNEGSIRLMKKCGFQQWGFLPRVAEFEGKWRGHYYYGMNF